MMRKIFFPLLQSFWLIWLCVLKEVRSLFVLHARSISADDLWRDHLHVILRRGLHFIEAAGAGAPSQPGWGVAVPSWFREIERTVQLKPRAHFPRRANKRWNEREREREGYDAEFARFPTY